MGYTYYDYLENHLESQYEYYYEHHYWPYFYGNYNGSNTTYNGTYPPSTYEYDAPYNMKLLTPPIFTIGIVCAILALILAITVVYKIRVSTPKKQNKFVIRLSLFTTFMHLFQNILGPIMYYYYYINYDPNSYIAISAYMLWDLTWWLAKLSIYWLFIYRYWIIFKASSATTEKEKCIIFGGFIATVTLQCVLYVFYFIHGYILATSNEEANAAYVKVGWMFLVLDTVLICVLTYLLCRSIVKLVVTIRKLGYVQHKLASFHVSMQTESVVITPSQQSELPASELVTNVTEESVNTPKLKVRMHSIDVHPTSPDIKDNDKMDKETKSKKVKLRQEKRLNFFLFTAARIAVTMLVAMISSFFYQFIWLLAVEMENYDMLWITFTWCIDTVINMLCVYLSMSFAKKHYKMFCADTCKFHQCILMCIETIVEILAK